MDTESIIQIVFIIILLFLSAFFSSAETAFTTVNKIRIRSMIDEGNKRAKTVAEITDNSSKMLSAILIGNNIVNIAVSSIVTTLTIKLWGSVATGIATGILTIIVLIFGEITPKTMATHHSERFALVYAPIIKFIMIIFTPFIIIINFLSGIIFKILRIDTNGKNHIITEDELRTYIKVSHEEGGIETNEKRLLNNIFDFDNSEAKDIMTPRIDMTLANINSTYEELIVLYKETMFTRIPIFENDPDNIIGILNIKDFFLLTDKNNFDLRSILRTPFFTYEHKNTSELFQEMQHKSFSIAIVLDEYGSTAGMITTEDLIEELIGEIKDEYDTDEPEPIIRLNSSSYKINGSLRLDDLNELLSTNLTSEDNDSIGGYIIEKLDRFPMKGEKLCIDNLEFIIDDASSTRIESIILIVKQPTSEE